MSTETKEPKWVRVLTIGGEATITQRQRNLALCQRLRDGFDDPRGFRDNGLSGFVYDVPIERFSLGPAGKSFSFRLDKNDECFYRLLHVIADHFDTKCDADDEVERLRAEVADLRQRLSRSGDRQPEVP